MLSTVVKMKRSRPPWVSRMATVSPIFAVLRKMPIVASVCSAVGSIMLMDLLRQDAPACGERQPLDPVETRPSISEQVENAVDPYDLAFAPPALGHAAISALARR